MDRWPATPKPDASSTGPVEPTTEEGEAMEPVFQSEDLSLSKSGWMHGQQAFLAWRGLYFPPLSKRWLVNKAKKKWASANRVVPGLVVQDRN